MSNINRAEQRLQNRVANELAHLKRENNAGRTRQLIGADNLVFASSNATSSMFTMGTDSYSVSTVTFTANPSTSKLFPLILTNLRLDVDDDAHSYPEGSSLSLAQVRDFRHHVYLDLMSSSPDTGVFVYRVLYVNETAAAISVYQRTMLRYPQVTV